ncbi:MAG TPA: hypothetical protein VH724_17085, partial [Candidatus Angelobacter sp.]|nr:hypothetical protein [Candidatus Angelobacter sp.]
MTIKDRHKDHFAGILIILTFGLAALFATGCTTGHNVVGGGTPTPTPVAGARMLVSDNSSGTVNVVNATTDVITHTIAVLSPGKMVSAGGTTLIQSTIAASVSIFDNATETIRFTVPLSGLPVDVAITPDGKTGWVAVGNGTVQSINTTTGAITGTNTIAGVQRIVIGPQGTTVLAFNDTVSNNFVVILPSPLSPTTITNVALDHPANGVFVVDDQHFLVMNCGIECGGTQANVVGVSLTSTGASTLTSPLTLSGATVGLLSGITAFIAGSPATGLNAGTLQVVNSSALTAGASIH